MPKKYLKKMCIILEIGKMQIKRTLRFHFTTVRMTETNKAIDNKYWKGCMGEGNPHLFLVGLQIDPALEKSVWKILKDLKISLSNPN